MADYNTDVLIIGAGPVGIFAAYQAGFLGMKTAVVDVLEEVGGQPQALYPYKYIYDIPGFPKILAKDLIANLRQQAQQFTPHYLMQRMTTYLQKNADNSFTVGTSTKDKITCKAIIIAAGAGAFGPNKPPLVDIDIYENTGHIHYFVRNPEDFKDKKIVIAGGGDSAVDWALGLHEYAAKIYVVHRRNNFRAAESSIQQMRDLAQNGKIELIIPYQLDSLVGGENKLQKVVVSTLDGQKKELEADMLLPLFGLSRSLGQLEEWGLNINKHNSSINVNPATYETEIPGIFAVGDVASYEYKARLISVGFGEAAAAAHLCWRYVFPDKVFHMVHSTSKES